MFEKVLVALDFSAYSQKILDCISEIPGIQDVVLLHVVDATHPSKLGWAPEPYIENAKLLMAEKKEALEHLGLKVHISIDVIVNVITQGNVSNAILEAAETHNVTLIIMGARGINPIQEILLGSVSSTVLRQAKTNVLVMHFNPVLEDTDATCDASHQKLFSRLLVPTDFSPSASDALFFIKTIPSIKEVILLHVVNRAESLPEIEAAIQESQTRLTEMKKDLIGSDIAVKHHIRVGDPTEMTLSVAKEDNVSLIAMSAYGTDWFMEMLVGSTTFTVVRRTRKPILVIRSGQGPTQIVK
ncbi:MAG: universal stress protein [Methanoregula sp.]|jgi:nucleotide-binding universal stress UspA family protein|nr:universal stress protein [Methanoregula sp.]